MKNGDLLIWRGEDWEVIPNEKLYLFSKSNIKYNERGQPLTRARIILGKEFLPRNGRRFPKQEIIEDLERKNRIRISKNGNPQMMKPESVYLTDDWAGKYGYSNITGYPTENAPWILQRIILTGSKEGDLIADFFAGSGTTAAVAEKLRRKWIAVDIGRFPIHTIRKRLLDIPYCKPFEVLNLGKYERKYWMDLNLGSVYRRYVDFILQLYKAKPVYDYKNIHGIISGKAVHVGPIDYPVTKGEVEECLREAKENGFESLDVLGWDFEMEFNDRILRELKESYNFGISLRIIPNEVMDKRAVEAGDVDFYGLWDKIVVCLSQLIPLCNLHI